jgi:hypothetical protein
MADNGERFFFVSPRKGKMAIKKEVRGRIVVIVAPARPGADPGLSGKWSKQNGNLDSFSV